MGRLLWDRGNWTHVEGHGVRRGEISAMHDAGRFHVDDDPLGRPRQVQLIGQVPASGRVITVAAEAFDGPDGTDYRPISAWPAERWERDAWYKEFGDAGDDD